MAEVMVHADSQPEKKDKHLTKKDLWKVFWYSMGIESGCSVTKQEAPGFTQAMIPVVEKVCETKEEKAEAYTRHTQLFLTEGRVAQFCVGVAAAMEERLAIEKDIEPDSINAVKVALMGPLAGIGDSLLHGTLRPIMAGIACSLVAASGYTSLAGPALFLAVMLATVMIIRYFGVFKGYSSGMSLVANMQEGGMLDKLTKYAAIAAFIVCGGFISSLVYCSTPITYATSETTIALQDVLDGIMPGVVPLMYTLLMYYLLSKKKVSAVLLMVGTMVLGIVCVYLGILA